MLQIQDTYKRSGGKRQVVTRVREVQEIDYGIYSTDPAVQRARNSAINAVHVNKGRCKG